MTDYSDAIPIVEARRPSLVQDALTVGLNKDKEAKVSVLASEKYSDRTSSPTSSTADGNEPNELELQTLRRVTGKIPWLAYTVAFVELCERFSVGAISLCFRRTLHQRLTIVSITVPPRYLPTTFNNLAQLALELYICMMLRIMASKPLVLSIEGNKQQQVLQH